MFADKAVCLYLILCKLGLFRVKYFIIISLRNLEGGWLGMVGDGENIARKVKQDIAHMPINTAQCP